MQILTCHRPLTLQLTIGRAITLREKGLLDVLAIPTDIHQLNAVLCDPILFTHILWELTDQSGLTFDSFAALITPADLDQFAEAFTREVMVFFPAPIRAVFQNVLENQSHASAISLPPKNPGEPSGASPESSESIPDPSASDNSTTWSSASSVLTGNVTQT